MSRRKLAVAMAGLAISGIAIADPVRVVGWWPNSGEIPGSARLMRAWAISTAGLCATLAGIPPEAAVSAVAAVSVPWDLEWGGTFGRFAAALNLAIIAALL